MSRIRLKQQQHVRENCFLKLKSLSIVTPKLRALYNGMMVSLRISVERKTIPFAAFCGPTYNKELCVACLES